LINIVPHTVTILAGSLILVAGFSLFAWSSGSLSQLIAQCQDPDCAKDWDTVGIPAA
jgi:hypothetical protein